MNKFSKAVKLINESDSIAIISHISPDGDTVGSGLALYRALETYGKNPCVFCDDTVPDKLSVIGDISLYNASEIKAFDLVISVDTATEERMGAKRAIFISARKTLNIDHHIGNTRYADENIVEERAATAEIAAELINELGVMDRTAARALYAGLITDTGGFQYSSVAPVTLRIAADLLGYGIEADKLSEELMSLTDKRVFNLRNRVLSRTRFYDEGRIALACVTKEDFQATDTDTSDTEGIVNIARNVRGVDVSIMMSEYGENVFKVSIRTTENANANAIAMRFGGGGHVRAGGLRISGEPEEVIEKLIKAACDELPDIYRR